MKSKHLPKEILCLDIISTLPETIIETILSFLPIQDAVRTSILSREWRYKWTKIPKLVFDENQMPILERTSDIPSERKEMTRRCRLFYAIYQVLLLHQGPILEFTLSMDANETCVEIDQIILYLSRNNALKRFTLESPDTYQNQYRIPLSIFLLHHLTDLRLSYCHIYFQPTFRGFGSLTRLYLRCIDISIKTLLHLLSNCPLLKSLTLLIDPENVLDAYDFTLLEFFQCLPVLEHLTVWGWVIQYKCFAEDVVPQELPISLIHLKYFSIKDINLIDSIGLPFLALLIRCSPNLETLKLEIFSDDGILERNYVVDYSDIRLEKLSELKIKGFGNYLKVELEFVKFVLAKSPKLKKVSILLDDVVTKDEELELLKILLPSPSLSHMVDIIVKRSF